MKPAQYLLNNIKWTFSRTDYSLVGTPSTPTELLHNLQTYCQGLQPTQILRPTCDFARFSLNQVFLSKPTNDGTRHLKTLYFHFANKLSNAEKVLQDAPALPAQDGQIVVEALAKNFVKATQGPKESRLWSDYCQQAQQYLCLSQQEVQYLNAFYDVYSCLYYATLYKLAKKDDKLLQICNFTSNFDLVLHKWIPNDYYARNFYKTSRLFSALDCFCNSATIFDGNRTDVVLNVRFNLNKRNVFDTFTQHKFGKKSANFRAQARSLSVVGHYHCYKNYEVRSYLVSNGKSAKGSLECLLRLDVGGKATHFTHSDTCCFAKDRLYVAVCCFVDGKHVSINPIVSSQHLATKSKSTIAIQGCTKQSHLVQFVTMYASNVEELTQSIATAHQIGFANAFAYSDVFTDGEVSTAATNLTLACSNLYENQPTSPTKPAKMCYQMGDVGVATLVDNLGNNATLINGFVANGGEGVYVVGGGKITKLNCGGGQISQDNLVYLSPNGELALSHVKGEKIYKVTTPKLCGVLFLLPLEEHSKVSPIAGGFVVSSLSRSFTIKHNGVVDSITTNALECNPSRLRCKLSGDLSSGTTLALSFCKTTSLQICVQSNNLPATEIPVVSGDNYSKQLNLCNQRIVFALTNSLSLPQPLSLAATAYTHPHWLKNYLNCAVNNNFEYRFYNADGKKRYKRDVTSTLFGALWLALVGFDTKLLDSLLPHTKEVLDGNLCLAYKALLVKKLADLGINKVSNILQLAEYKKQIAKDKDSLSLAQAVGAIALNYPSVQRLADLTKQHKLPPSWQYVAYYEVLCKLQLAGGKVAVKPTPSAQGFVADNFVVRLTDKQVQLKFVPSKIPSATFFPTKRNGKVDANSQDVCGQIVVKY